MYIGEKLFLGSLPLATDAGLRGRSLLIPIPPLRKERLWKNTRFIYIPPRVVRNQLCIARVGVAARFVTRADEFESPP